MNPKQQILKWMYAEQLLPILWLLFKLKGTKGCKIHVDQTNGKLLYLNVLGLFTYLPVWQEDLTLQIFYQEREKEKNGRKVRLMMLAFTRLDARNFKCELLLGLIATKFYKDNVYFFGSNR